MENLDEGIDRFETNFTESEYSITSKFQDYHYWREENARGLREEAQEFEEAGDMETAEQLRESADELEWTFNPGDHDTGDENYNMRNDLDRLEEAIEDGNIWLDDEFIFHGDQVVDAEELPELESRDSTDESFDSDNLDGKSVFRVWAYNSYFRYNSGGNTPFLFDEYGIPLRNLTGDNAIAGGPNLDHYIDEYEEENWQ